MATDLSAQRGLANQTLPRPVTGAGAAHSVMGLLPAVILFYAAMAPYEVRIEIAGQTLYAYRIAAFAVLPLIVLRVFHEPMRWVFLDAVVAFGSMWMVFAFIVLYSSAEGAASGISRALDVILPYLVGRVCIRGVADLRRFLVFVAPGVALAAMSLASEVLTDQLLVRPAAASVFGALPLYGDGAVVAEREYTGMRRMGILRASGPFPHPILGGLFLAVLFPLYLSSAIRSWPKIVGVAAGLAAVFTISSTGLLVLIISAAAISFDWIQRQVTFLSWRVALPVLAAILFVLDMLAENGIANVLARYSLDPQTARYRNLIWEYGSQSVMRHPWFGIGYSGYERLPWMVESVDHNWLNLAIRFGIIPSLAFLFVAIAAVVIISRSSAHVAEIDRRLYVAIAIALVAVILAGTVVSFFGGTQTWMYMLMAIGVSIGASSREIPKNVLTGMPRPRSTMVRERLDGIAHR